MNDDHIDEALAETDPARTIDLQSSQIRDALDALRLEISHMHDTSKAHTPKRQRRAVIAIAALVIVGTATVAAAAGGLFTRTGTNAAGGEAGTGEMLRLDAPDAPDVLRSIGADIPLPPGGNFDEIVDNLPTEAADEAEEGVLFTLEFNAACQWATYWLAAEQAGDADAIARAQTALDLLPEREALTANASPPDATANFWTRIADAARAGDPETMRNIGYTANCTGITPGE